MKPVMRIRLIVAGCICASGLAVLSIAEAQQPAPEIGRAHV